MMIQNLKITKNKETQEKNLMYLRGDTVMLVGKIWNASLLESEIRSFNYEIYLKFKVKLIFI